MITVLTVAGDPAIHDLAAAHLPSKHIDTIEASTAWEALMLIRAQFVDLVLLSEEDGGGMIPELVARAVRETPLVDQVPVIVISNERVCEDRRKVLCSIGVDTVVDARRMGMFEGIIEMFLASLSLSYRRRQRPNRWVVSAALLLDEGGEVLGMDHRARSLFGRERARGEGQEVQDADRWLRRTLPGLRVALTGDGPALGLHPTGAGKCVAVSRAALGPDLSVTGIVLLRVRSDEPPRGEARRGSARRPGRHTGRHTAYEICGPSQCAQRLRAALVDRSATLDPVLLTGPRGCHPEALARIIHGEGRRKGAFLSVRAWEVEWILMETRELVRDYPGGLERLRGGSLFLDEIDRLPARLQRVLAGVIARESFRLRLIAWADDVAGLEDRLEPALYELFRGRILDVPPLAERPEDVVPIARRTLVRMESHARIAPEAGARLRAHGWQGDVAELEALVVELGRDYAGEVIPLEAVATRLSVRVNAGESFDPRRAAPSLGSEGDRIHAK